MNVFASLLLIMLLLAGCSGAGAAPTPSPSPELTWEPVRFATLGDFTKTGQPMTITFITANRKAVVLGMRVSDGHGHEWEVTQDCTGEVFSDSATKGFACIWDNAPLVLAKTPIPDFWDGKTWLMVEHAAPIVLPTGARLSVKLPLDIGTVQKPSIACASTNEILMETKANDSIVWTCEPRP